MLSATLFWAFGGVFGRKTGASGVVLTFWRMWVASGLFAVIALATGRWPSRSDVRRSALAGLFFGLNVAAFFTAIETVSVATALIIGALSPIVAMPIAVYFFKEHVSALKIVCGSIAVAGVITAVLTAPQIAHRPGGSVAGYLWAVVSLSLWVGYLLLAKRVRAHVETVRFLFVTSFVGALAVSVAAAVSGDPLNQVHGMGWFWIVCLVLGPGLAGHGLVAWAQPRVDASATAVLIQAEPVFASVVAWVFLGERMSLPQSLAMTVVIGALVTLARREATLTQVEMADVPL